MMISSSRNSGWRRVGLLSTFGALFIGGCASGPVPPAPMTCTIETSADVNPTISKRPSPLLMRVYALKSAAAFGDADFIALYQHDQTELATELTGKDEYTVVPGEHRSCSKLLSTDTRYIAVMAAYRDIEHATWRSIAPIEGGKKATVVVHASALSVDVVVTR